MSFIYSLCSSSSGNSTYIGDRENGILVDCGLSFKAFDRSLSFIGIDKSAVKAIFITHEHTDHIKGLSAISNACNVPIYAPKKTAEYIIFNKLIKPQKTINIVSNEESNEVCGLQIKGFVTPHDSLSSMGYRCTFANYKTVTLCTDLGVVTPSVYDNLSGSNAVLLESNYDDYMLRSGPYPAFLKKRIAGENGHLSNECCANTLVDLFNDGTTAFILGHLSEHNNLPELAFKSALSSLIKTGGELNRDFTLSVSRKQTIGDIVEI